MNLNAQREKRFAHINTKFEQGARLDTLLPKEKDQISFYRWRKRRGYPSVARVVKVKTKVIKVKPEKQRIEYEEILALGKEMWLALWGDKYERRGMARAFIEKVIGQKLLQYAIAGYVAEKKPMACYSKIDLKYAAEDIKRWAWSAMWRETI